METTLICALTRKRAIEIARERAGALRSLEQNKMRYSGALDGGDWEWAYIGDLAAIFGRPAGIRVILDKSAQQLNEWSAIIEYIARNDFRCEWIGNWGAVDFPITAQALTFAKELERIGYCAVCKKETIQVYLYEKPGLLHFRHAGGKECRVALDMKNLEVAAQTILRAVRTVRANAENPLIAVSPGEIPGGPREWIGPGEYRAEDWNRLTLREKQQQKERWSREMLDRALMNQLRQAPQEQIDELNKGAQQAKLDDWEKIEAIQAKWLDEKTYQRKAMQAQWLDEKTYQRMQKLAADMQPEAVEPPKPVLPSVIQRNTIRKVKFD